ncbi:MAG: succinate dehydrogenase assembly factor 4 [Pseudomonadota bacterium]|mgnify:CR=1 FL=1|nr:succinate dehydrogenase assembly factor 4 [Pseudomonadota bacterium]
MKKNKQITSRKTSSSDIAKKSTSDQIKTERKKDKILEHGGPKGLEPTRYGDWERKGRCIDF